MKERPILFSGPMVRAILDGTKTQTRRPMNPQPYQAEKTRSWFWSKGDNHHVWSDHPFPHIAHDCPLGVPGDRLWVRETWQLGTDKNSNACVAYKADGKALGAWANDNGDGEWCKVEGEVEPMPCPIWRPSIHMERWASRINLEIVSVRVQRVQEISEEDAKAEGMELVETSITPIDVSNNRGVFHWLWNSCYSGDLTWHANPWVWAIEFKRV